MKTIMGLVKKDLYTLKSYRKTVLTFLIIFCAVGFFQKINGFFMMMIALGLGMCAIATFNYDEFNHSDRYLLTLPVTRKQVVQSKYLLSFLFLFLGVIIGYLVSILFAMMNHQTVNMVELLFSALGVFFVIGLMQVIQIPCIYRYGAEKGRIQSLIVIAILIGIALGIGYLCSNILSIYMNSLETWLNHYGILTFLFLIGFIYIISYRISYQIVLKKEF